MFKSLHLSALLVFLLSSLCLAGSKPLPRLRVFISIAPLKEAVETIGGPRFEVQELIPPGYTPEDFEPNSRTYRELGHSRAFFAIGMPYEDKLLSLLRSSMPQVRIFDCTEGLEFRDFPGHDGKAAPDPHVWLSLDNMQTISVTLGRCLAQLLPEEAVDIQKRAQVYVGKLRQLDAELTRQFQPYRGRTLLVTHPAFGYFTDAYQLRQLAVEQEGKEPGPKELNEFIRQAREDKCRAIFYPLQHGDRLAFKVAKRVSLNTEVKPLDPLPVKYLEGVGKLAEEILKGL